MGLRSGVFWRVGSMFLCLTRRFEQESNFREEAEETYTELLIRELRKMQIYGGERLARVSLDASWYEQHSNKCGAMMHGDSFGQIKSQCTATPGRTVPSGCTRDRGRACSAVAVESLKLSPAQVAALHRATARQKDEGPG